jgi:hypothetical protein
MLIGKNALEKMPHAYDPSYLEGVGGRVVVQGQPRHKTTIRYLKND